METKQGRVKGIFSNPFDRGDKTIYLNSFLLEEDPMYYRTGERSLGMINRGDVIKFETEKKGNNWHVNTDSVEKLPGSAPTESGPPRQFGGKPKEEKDYWSRKEARDVVTQDRIQFQAARNSAIDMARLLIENEAVPTKDTAGKPLKTGNKFDIINALVAELTSRFYKDASNVEEAVTIIEENKENNADDQSGFDQ